MDDFCQHGISKQHSAREDSTMQPRGTDHRKWNVGYMNDVIAYFVCSAIDKLWGQQDSDEMRVKNGKQ